MIKQIYNAEVEAFLKKHKANKEHIYPVVEYCECFGYFIDNHIVAVCALRHGNTSSRIKSCYTIQEYRGNGYMTKLLKAVLINNKLYTAFATDKSINIFKKLGLKEQSKKNNITFLKGQYV